MMGNRKLQLEESIKEQGGKVIITRDGKANMIYPDSWSPQSKKRKKKQ